MVRLKDIRERAGFEVRRARRQRRFPKGGPEEIGEFHLPSFPRNQTQSHFDRRERLPAVIPRAFASLAPLELSNAT